MTDSISPVAQLQAYLPQRSAGSEPAPAAADAAPAAQSPAAAPPGSAGKAPDPVALSVDRDASGVFVYTLTDSASGRVLAVIPRSAVVTAAQQPLEGVDIQA